MGEGGKGRGWGRGEVRGREGERNERRPKGRIKVASEGWQ